MPVKYFAKCEGRRDVLAGSTVKQRRGKAQKRHGKAPQGTWPPAGPCQQASQTDHLLRPSGSSPVLWAVLGLLLSQKAVPTPSTPGLWPQERLLLAQTGTHDLDAGLKGSPPCMVGDRCGPGAQSHAGYQGQVLCSWDISKTCAQCPQLPCCSHVRPCKGQC